MGKPPSTKASAIELHCLSTPECKSRLTQAVVSSALQSCFRVYCSMKFTIPQNQAVFQSQEARANRTELNHEHTRYACVCGKHATHFVVGWSAVFWGRTRACKGDGVRRIKTDQFDFGQVSTAFSGLVSSKPTWQLTQDDFAEYAIANRLGIIAFIGDLTNALKMNKKEHPELSWISLNLICSSTTIFELSGYEFDGLLR